MDERTPMVSVVLPCYNHEKYIEEAIDSVMNQTFHDFELIITDDGSTDRSRELIQRKIEQYNRDPRIRFYPNEQNTCFSNIDKAFASARGRYIASISGDDKMMPEKLEKQVKFLEEHRDRYKACVTWIECIGEDSAKKDSLPAYFNRDNVPLNELLKTLLLKGNCLCSPTFMVDREAFVRYGGMDFDFRQTQDYVLWLRYLMDEELYIIPEKLTCYRVVKGSLSDSAVDPEAEIRTYEEQEELLFEIFADMKAHVFDRIFPDTDGSHHDTKHLMCRKVKCLIDCTEQNTLLGAVAIRLYYLYKKEPGFTELLATEYGIDRRFMHGFVGRASTYSYVVHQQNRLRVLTAANQAHRFDLGGLHKSNADMIGEMLQMMEAGQGVLTLDHIASLYDYCKANGNPEEDFLAMLYEAREKGVKLFS